MVGPHRRSLMVVSAYWRSGPEPLVNFDVLRVQATGTWCAEKAFSLDEGGRKENTGLEQIEDFNFGAPNLIESYEHTGGCHTGGVELLGREQRRSNRTQELLMSRWGTVRSVEISTPTRASERLANENKVPVLHKAMNRKARLREGEIRSKTERFKKKIIRKSRQCGVILVRTRRKILRISWPTVLGCEGDGM